MGPTPPPSTPVREIAEGTCETGCVTGDTRAGPPPPLIPVAAMGGMEVGRCGDGFILFSIPLNVSVRFACGA